MFDCLIESGGHHVRRSLPALSVPAMWSAGAHAAIVAWLVLSATGIVESGAAEDYKEALFLLPLLPAPGASKVEPIDGVVYKQGSAQGIVAPERAGGIVPILGQRRRTAVAERSGAAVDASADTSSLSLSAAYMEAELDVAAERDPMSSAPVYPETLRSAGIEGHVIAQYIIDTTGYADVGSFRAMDATHPLFTVAVQEALPGMHFRPAELSGRRVRQIVLLEFKFVISRE
jgi:protein TonB